MSRSFAQFDVKVKVFRVTMQNYIGEPLTPHQIGEVLLDLEQKINSMMLDNKEKNVLANARIHIEIPVEHPIIRWPE